MAKLPQSFQKLQLSLPPLRREALKDLPAPFTDFYVRELRADEAGIWKSINQDLEAGNGFQVEKILDLVVMTVVDEDNEQVFNHDAGREAIGQLGWALVQEVFMRSLNVGRMSAEGIRAEKKASSETQSSDSSSD